MLNIVPNTTEKQNIVDFNRSRSMTILAVEDDIVSMGFLESQIESLQHKIVKAHNGQEAIDILNTQARNIDVVLMDREMPIMDGLTAVKYIKNNPLLRNIPVIMVTGADSIEEMRQGLDAGVFYYLTKPVEEEMLRSVLTAATREAEQNRTLQEELSRHRTSFDLLDTGKFKFQTLTDAESLSAFLANCFPDPSRVITGLGELLINAIEHGNLSIGYTRKTELLNQNIWRAEINKRQLSEDYNQKYAEAVITKKDDGVYVVITDQGDGFDWKKFMRIDHSRAGDNHGRGIAQANATSFDKLTYNDKGNQVIAFVGLEKQLEW